MKRNKSIIPIIEETRDIIRPNIECKLKYNTEYNRLIKRNKITARNGEYDLKTSIIFELYRNCLLNAIKSIFIDKYSFERVQFVLLRGYKTNYKSFSDYSLEELLSNKHYKLVIKCIDMSGNIYTGFSDIQLNNFTKFNARMTLIKLLKDVITPESFLRILIPAEHFEYIRAKYTHNMRQYLNTSYNIDSVLDNELYRTVDLFTVKIKPLDDINKQISKYSIGMKDPFIDIDKALLAYSAFKNDNINYLIKQLEIRFNDIKYKDIKVRRFTFDKLANGFSQLASFFKFLDDKPQILQDLVKDTFKYVFDRVDELQWLFDAIKQYESDKDFFFDDLYTKMKYYLNTDLFITVIGQLPTA